MKKVKKILALVLSVAMLSTGMVFTMPAASAASFPSGLYNGTKQVVYTAGDAAKGKYLVEIDAVKYNPNIAQESQAIASEAGDIIITYRPKNGTAPEVTERFEDVIAMNAFNYVGEGSFVYYAVLDGYPQKATISARKTNMADNDSGIYAGIKIWNTEVGSFENIYDFSKIERSNGADTSSLLFSNVSVLAQYFPFAKQGSATGGNLTLPAGLSANSAVQTFTATDQWGVTMIAPNIDYTPVTGLTFSQNQNVMTLKGTGDANNPNGSSRSVVLTATYDTMNTSVANTFSLTKNVTVSNSSPVTYAPTFANREKAGLQLSFKTSSSSSIEKFELNSSYQMTTTNYLVVKNNASRKASIKLASTANDKVNFSSSTLTLEAGASTNIQLLDLKSASANYTLDVTATYTLEGLYDAATGSLESLTAGSAIPLVYSNYNYAPSGVVYQAGGFMYSEINMDVRLESTNHSVLFEETTPMYLHTDPDEYMWGVNVYVDRSRINTYQDAGMRFFFTSRKNHQYYFQDQDDYLGPYYLTGSYNNSGTFAFNAEPGAYTSAHKEKVGLDLGKGVGVTKTQNFNGTIFTGSTSVDAPATLYLDHMQIHAWGSGSAYFTLPLNIYAYNKTELKSQINTCLQKNLLSCYYSATAYSNYASMNSSAMKTALEQRGVDKTSQYKVSTAKTQLNSAFNNLVNSSVANGTYSLIHNKHVGDITTAIEETSVDFYVFENGSSNALKFKAAYADACNKHSDAYMPTMTTSGTYEHTFDYWNIDFSDLNALLALYAEVAPAGQFVNVDEAVGSELRAARNLDTTSATANPSKQTDVEIIVNNLKAAMRNLKYKSYNMHVYHKMLTPSGTEEIDNDIIHNYLETYNKTATYGEVEDGTAVLTDGTYTVKGYHFEPQPDSTFKEYASRYYYQGISSEYLCEGEKDITMVYYAKSIESTQLAQDINEVETHVDEWDGMYTENSINAFVDWFDAKYDAGELTKIFSVFDQAEYDALVAEFEAEMAKLDRIATEEQVQQIEQFIANYEMLQDFGDAFCHAADMIANYADAYTQAQELSELAQTNNAGTNAAAAVLDSVKDFKVEMHVSGAHSLVTAPKDGVDGSYSLLCSNCGNMIDSGIFASPKFNRFSFDGYNYSNRGASLRIKGESAASDYQDVRFTASCNVPDGAEVTDFGFVYTQTKYLNGGAEPNDNTPINVDQLVEGGMYVTKFSMFDGQYSIHASDDGDVYTFNLVLKLRRNNWNTHYAARSYITYELDGIEVTVYDASYSSRTAKYIAECAVNNPYESPSTKAYLTEKFGL